MNSLWDRLKPEYKMIIQKYIDDGNYTAGPQNMRKVLIKYTLWGELTVENLRDFFMWTDQCLTDMDWEDVFGDRFVEELIFD
tara:strand:+ start:672 stop:917 length:246 start_codon:yes stop_codon:yes gene_type:complete